MFKAGSLRQLSRWLVVATLVVLAVAVWWVYRVSIEEKELVVESSYRISESLVIGIEAHLDETLRDARNAVYSAALLLERAPQPGQWRRDWLHTELNRELSDHTSIARMIVASADGTILASSAEATIPAGTALAPEVRQWHLARPAATDFHLGVTRNSTVSGTLVIPYSRAIFSKRQAIIGYVVAEIDFPHFVRLYDRMLKGTPGVVRWFDRDGVRLMVYPFIDSALGGTISRDFPQHLLHGPGGRIELKAKTTGRIYYFATMQGHSTPVMLAVGQDRSEVLAGWVAKTRTRGIVLLLVAIIFVCLIATLRRNLSRLADNETRLEANAAQLRAISDNVPEGVVYQLALDAAGEPRFLYISAAVERLNGLSPEAVLRNPDAIIEQILPEDLPVLKKARAHSFKTETALDVTVRLRRKDGELRWMRFCSAPRRLAEGSLAWDGIELDVTERVRAEDEVRSLNRELEQRVEQRTRQLFAANRNLEAFAYSVAHDLRAPLFRISGFAELLRKELGDLQAGGKHKLEVITREVRRMSDMINGLLELARTDRVRLNTQTVDLGQMAAEIAEELSLQHPARQIRWVHGTLPVVQGDAVLLRQVLVNLMSNAVKFTRDRTPAQIALGTERKDDKPGEVCVFVKDNGAGFDMAYAEKLFSAFQRLHSYSQFEGHGIGLALVQRIVERHGGRVWAFAEPDAGATFWFALPLPAQAGSHSPVATLSSV
jgi:PAS domain S-box-containing protein